MIKGLLMDYGGVVVDLNVGHEQAPSSGYTMRHVDPRPGIIGLVNRARKRGLQVGILSNVSSERAAMGRAGGDYQPYDFAVLSPEVGLRKPDPQIYELAANKFTGISPHEILYVDDLARNLTPARRLGMVTLLATDDIVSDLETYL